MNALTFLHLGHLGGVDLGYLGGRSGLVVVQGHKDCNQGDPALLVAGVHTFLHLLPTPAYIILGSENHHNVTDTPPFAHQLVGFDSSGLTK